MGMKIEEREGFIARLLDDLLKNGRMTEDERKVFEDFSPYVKKIIRELNQRGTVVFMMPKFPDPTGTFNTLLQTIAIACDLVMIFSPVLGRFLACDPERVHMVTEDDYRPKADVANCN